MREALALDYERVLFLEDDIRFLKDLRELEAALDATPDGYDVVQFDKLHVRLERHHVEDAESCAISSAKTKVCSLLPLRTNFGSVM